jgi:aspartate aminotransferase-like enzyme
MTRHFVMSEWPSGLINPLGAVGGVAVVVKKFLNVDAICSSECFEK